MYSPDELIAKIHELWDRGEILCALMDKENALFPLAVPAMRSGVEPVWSDLAELLAWKQSIESHCKCSTGHGYRIEYREIDAGEAGRQRIPDRLVFERPSDAADFIGKQQAVAQFARLSSDIRRRCPTLSAWIKQYPMKLLEYRDDWPLLLAILDHFLLHPQPNRGLHELAIAGVDALFIENHKDILNELLDQVLPVSAIHTRIGGTSEHGFAPKREPKG